MNRTERFMSKVDTSGDCWIWKGAKTTGGYGQFWNGDRKIVAHRFLLEPEKAKKLQSAGMEACHSCDNRLCVRPSHIFIGTRSDNMRDCSSKGRLRFENGLKKAKGKRKIWHRGQANHAAKLTDADVSLIKSISPAYGRGAKIARHFGVSLTVVSGIWKGSRWSHVAPESSQRAEAFGKTMNLW